MVRLASRTKCPPNGFMFHEASTGKQFSGWDFEGMVREIQSHRMGNPRFNLPTDLDTIRTEVDHANALRCLSITGAASFIVSDEGSPPLPKAMAPNSSLVGRVAGAATNIATGIETLTAWLGKGGVPVEHALAQQRSDVCVTCPKNGRGDLTRFFTVPAAELIRKQIGMKRDMALFTSHDENLGVCEACGCPLKLKVHVPISEIKEHMDSESKTHLDSRCWILHE